VLVFAVVSSLVIEVSGSIEVLPRLECLLVAGHLFTLSLLVPVPVVMLIFGLTMVELMLVVLSGLLELLILLVLLLVALASIEGLLLIPVLR